MYLSKDLLLKIGIGLVAISIPTIFVASSLTSEAATCKNAGYADYKEGDDMVYCAPKIASIYNNISIVYGNTANTPTPQIEKDKDNKHNYSIYPVLRNSIAGNFSQENGPSYISLISAASNKKSTDFNIEETDNAEIINTAELFIEWVANSISKINNELKNAPSANGAQYLEAINKAGRSGSANEKSIIYVYGSGLSDGGLLNFAANDYLNQDVDTLISEFSNKNPKLENLLKGKTIVWYGIGQTIAPQDDLCDAEKETLKELYEGILKAEGAKEVYFESEARADSSIENNPYTVNKTSTNCEPIIITLNEEELPFIGGKATYRDEDKAISALSNIAQENRNNLKKINIVGYMAPDKCRDAEITDLPLERANTVKNSLVSLGIDESRITTKNGGFYEPEVSICPDGYWSEEVAKTKRLVKITIK